MVCPTYDSTATATITMVVICDSDCSAAQEPISELLVLLPITAVWEVETRPAAPRTLRRIDRRAESHGQFG